MVPLALAFFYRAFTVTSVIGQLVTVLKYDNDDTERVHNAVAVCICVLLCQQHNKDWQMGHNAVTALQSGFTA